jgi:hypothetical protein
LIDWLNFSKSANFYRKTGRLPKDAITKLFRDLRQHADSPSNNIFQHVKVRQGGSIWSAISFFYEREPAFFDGAPPTVREKICGFLLLVEHGDIATIFKSNLDLPSEFRSDHLRRIADDRVELAVARAGATFEQIRLRNMTNSRSMLRFKTLEADNLENVVTPFGASRFVPRGYRVRQNGDHYTATPSTGRIAMRSDRGNYRELVTWAGAIIDMLTDQTAQPSDFIRTFARPMDLASLPVGTVPTYFSVDSATLSFDLFDTEEPRELVRSATNGVTTLTRVETEDLLRIVDREFTLLDNGGIQIVDAASNDAVGEISIGKTRISLRRFDLPELRGVRIRSVDHVPGEEHLGIPLKRYLDQQDLFTVLFSDVTIVYLEGSLFRDGSLRDGSRFLSYFRVNDDLNNSTSEKGTLLANQVIFEVGSLFQIIVDSVSASDGNLACDDLGDEWADFIGVNRSAQPQTLSFYHAKHGDAQLGASPLHILVSQAVKNLGRFTSTPEILAAKVRTWGNTYNGDGIETSIPRLVRGDAAAMEQALNAAVASPDTIRRVFIVTSSLSFESLRETFMNISAGTAARPHFVQLYWLLMSYFSACTEVGAYPYVICRE